MIEIDVDVFTKVVIIYLLTKVLSLYRSGLCLATPMVLIFLIIYIYIFFISFYIVQPLSWNFKCVLVALWLWRLEFKSHLQHIKHFYILHLLQILALQKELEERKQSMQELENKLKFKEETAVAAMAAREAAEKSLRLADIRSTRLRERLEELSRLVEQSDGPNNLLPGGNGIRYACWPWQWLGLNFVRAHGGPGESVESSNEMELSEPLI